MLCAAIATSCAGSNPSTAAARNGPTQALVMRLLQTPLRQQDWLVASASPTDASLGQLATSFRVNVSAELPLGEPLLVPTAWRTSNSEVQFLADTTGAGAIGRVKIGFRQLECDRGDDPKREQSETDELLDGLDVETRAGLERGQPKPMVLDCSNDIYSLTQAVSNDGAPGFATNTDTQQLAGLIADRQLLVLTDGSTIISTVDRYVTNSLNLLSSDESFAELASSVSVKPKPLAVAFVPAAPAGVIIVAMYTDESAAKMAEQGKNNESDPMSGEPLFASMVVTREGRVVFYTAPGLAFGEIFGLAQRGGFPMFITG